MRGRRSIQPYILQAALTGLEAQLERTDKQIAQVKAVLGRRGSAGPAAPSFRRERVLSAAARKRIAAAQPRRWADWQKKRKAN